MDNRVGQQLDRYLLTRFLGSGGFGKVYLAQHVDKKTLVAVKILPQLAEHDWPGFLNEVRRSFLLKHPHIVGILDFGMEDHTPFIVMEYAPHQTVRHLYPKGTHVPLAHIIPYVKQVAEALQYIHNEKLIHRDIKPGNMLLGQNNEILLSDFGIATIAHSSRSQRTQDIVGTITYMAPEQIGGKPVPASDQYSLGVVVYEWLCGECPFNGVLAEIVTQHMMKPPPPLREKAIDIPPDVEQVVLTALAKDPHRRFTSVQAFAHALEQASQPKPILSSTSPIDLAAPTLSIQAKSEQADKPHTYEHNRAPARRNDLSATAVVIAVIVLLFLIFAAFAYYGPSATVTITVPSQAFNLNGLKFTATDTTRQNSKLATLPAEVLTFRTTVQGSGTATGSEQLGTGVATGNVVFTNTSAQNIEIPFGTLLSTSNGILFTTGAVTRVPANGNYPVNPIHAQNPGQSGNVGANTITIIPAAGLAQIQQDPTNAGLTITATTLTVTNPTATTGGGAATTVTVSSKDVSTLKAQLEQQILTQQVERWLKQRVHAGDVVGHLPAPQDSITTTPQEGQVVSTGSFKGTLTYQLQVLVVRAATIQAEVSVELNAEAAKQYPGYVLVPGQFRLDTLKDTSPADGKSVSFSLEATEEIVLLVSTQQLASLLARQGVDDAKTGIKNGSLGGLHNVQGVTITVSPGFFPWLPFREDNIHILFKFTSSSAAQVSVDMRAKASASLPS